jgi:DNA-binding protein H-NS
MDLNLDELGLSDLKEFQKKISIAIESFEHRKRNEALDAINEVAKLHGFKIEELMDAGGKKKSKAKALPKYANPENSELAWSGRGRKPLWVIAHLEAGNSMDEILIK